MYDLYIADLNTLTDDRFALLFERMPQERREKINRCKMTADKRRSLGAGALLEYARKHFGINGKTELAYTELDKPYFPDLPNVHFNLSHSGDMVMCIIATNEVGCDIEQISEKANMEIARRFFFCDEYLALQNTKSREEQLDVFFSLWTLKESFIKCVGAGLSLPLDSFCISKGKKITVVQDTYKGDFAFCEVDVPGNYKCSYCIKDYYGGFISQKYIDFGNIVDSIC